MKRALIVPFVVLMTAAALLAQADIINKLGSNLTEAHDAVFSTLSGGHAQMAGTPDVFKAAGDQARTAMVTAVFAFARSYSTTADFAKRYAQFRENQKPDAPEAPRTANDVNADMRKGLEEGIKNLEKAATQLPQMKKQFDAQIAEMRKQLAAVGGDKKQDAQMDAIFKESAAMEAQEHKKRLAAWEGEYPADPKGLIARRLREFLALSATVDFNARLTKVPGKPPIMKFENPAYEQKDANWKYLYRAGKPAVDAARSQAQDWLKAIGS